MIDITKYAHGILLISAVINIYLAAKPRKSLNIQFNTFELL